ncbi:hypothetical protein ASG40_19455 [Methylobacterium sp. Leaf399]|nr:hypothetical protein ASG40_19455 [Methylobacterium sp. Leaf399]
MGWLRPNRVDARQEQLDAILAENVLASSKAEATADEIAESVQAEEAALLAAIEDTRLRRLAREKRARERARRDPGLAAVNEVLKLLEGRS